jgi:hypothetical protein
VGLPTSSYYWTGISEDFAPDQGVAEVGVSLVAVAPTAVDEVGHVDLVVALSAENLVGVATGPVAAAVAAATAVHIVDPPATGATLPSHGTASS